MIELIIYLIGYVWSYYLWRKMVRECNKDNYSWNDVLLIIAFSIGSYLSVIALLFSNWLESSDEIKPPKFL